MKLRNRDELEKKLSFWGTFLNNACFIKNILESNELSDEQLELIISEMPLIACLLRGQSNMEILKNCANIAINSQSPAKSICQYFAKKLNNEADRVNEESAKPLFIKDSKWQILKNIIITATSDFEIKFFNTIWEFLNEDDTNIINMQIQNFRKLFEFFALPHVKNMIDTNLLIEHCCDECVVSNNPAVNLLSNLQNTYDKLQIPATLEFNFCYLNAKTEII